MSDPEAERPWEWGGLPPAHLVRATAALALAALLSGLGALVLGEYQFEGFLPLGAGLLFGLVVGEVVVEVGRRRTWPVGAVAAALVGAGLLWAGWIASGDGLEPLRGGVYLAVAVGIVACFVRVAGIPGRARR
jgi:hypothetical protein